jgi:branched-chain amino acid aminotransferase
MKNYTPSVFESIRSYNGAIFRLDEHLARIKRSARALNVDLSKNQIAGYRKAIQDRYKQSRIKNAYIRMSVFLPSRQMQLIIKAADVYPPQIYKKGVFLKTVASGRPPAASVLANIKSSNYLSAICARAQVGVAFEVLMLTAEGRVAEASVSNIFMAKGGRIFTPAASAQILAGITRQVVFELAKGLSVSVDEHDLTRHDLYNADECFLTNTGIGILPVVTIDARRIGSGLVGILTKRLMKEFKKITGGINDKD